MDYSFTGRLFVSAGGYCSIQAIRKRPVIDKTLFEHLNQWVIS